MININNKEYLSYEEQVLKNKKDIEKLQQTFIVDGFTNINVMVSIGGTKLKQLPGIFYSINKYEVTLEIILGGFITFTKDDDIKLQLPVIPKDKLEIIYDNGEYEINDSCFATIKLNDTLIAEGLIVDGIEVSAVILKMVRLLLK